MIRHFDATRLFLSAMVLGFLVTPLSIATAESQPTLVIDQSQTMSNLGANLYNQGLAQSFVPTQSNLARVDVMLNGWQTTLGSFVYKVFADNGAGVPDVSSALVTGMLVPRQDCQFTDVTFNGWFVADFTDISVNPGGVYYIWVNLPLGSPDWAANWKSWDSILDGNNIDYYPQGEAWNFVELVPHPYPAPQADFTFITYYSPLEEVAWAVEASPHTLNLKSNGNSIAVNIELPAGFGFSDIDVSPIQLNGVPQASGSSPQIGDFDNDGLTDLAVKFPRQEVLLTLSVGDSMLVVTGTGSGIHFVGNCTVKVIG
jgi:hypothetical protein